MKLSGKHESDTCTAHQQEAIQHKEGPCMVLAGPGSGKTFVITRRIQYLIEKHQVDPEKILVITFSKASALEMKERFMNLCGEEYYPVTFGTFHAIYFQMIKRAYQLDNNHIITEKEKRNLCKDILMAYSDHYIVDEDFTELVLKEISVVKNSGKSIQDYQTSFMEPEEFRQIFIRYRKEMSYRRKIDFDDMVLLTYELFCKRPDIAAYWRDIYEYILIDEFQDINQIQFQVVRMLLGEKKNLFVVGDDDQAIYGFRGSKPEIMLQFKHFFPGYREILLDYNFRSNELIVDCAKKVISENKIRYQKEIKSVVDLSEDSVRVLPFEQEEDENQFLVKELLEAKRLHTLKEHAVLFRMNLKMEPLMELLSKNQIPFSCKEQTRSIYDHFVAKDLFAYLSFAEGETSRECFYEFMNKPVRYIKREDVFEKQVDFINLQKMVRNRSYVYENVRKLEYDLSKLKKLNPFASIVYIRKAIGYDDYLKKLAKEKDVNPTVYLEIADELMNRSKDFSTFSEWRDAAEMVKKQIIDAKNNENEDAVTLITMHGSKGLEWEKVYIPYANEGVLPSPKALTNTELEEERRLFYVAMTRAKNQLTILYENGKGKNSRCKSRFLIPILQRMSKMSMNFSTNC